MMNVMMPHQEIAIANHALATGESRETIPSRFGEIVIDTRNTLYFPKGMLGLPNRQHFALANFPSEGMRQFKLLQSLDEVRLSFIGLPLGVDNAIIRGEDARNACRDLAIREEDLVMLLVVCVHREGEGARLSVNARAPVMIDARRKTGQQYVFPNDAYKVQHYIS